MTEKNMKATSHEALENIAGMLQSLESSLKYVDLAAVENGETASQITASAGRISRRLAKLAGGEELPRYWPANDLAGTEQPRFLAKGRLPRAAVSLNVGDEGIGKSLLWTWLAAPVTTGKAAPEFGIPARDPAMVDVVVTEDYWSDTVRPRLEVAGADLDMIRVICVNDDGSGAPEFPRDLCLIFEADPAPALVVVDAWLDTVPANLSVRDPQQARQALHPWKELATATDAAVLLVCHTNRVASPNARDRYGATAELRKKARMTLFAQQDDEGHLLVGPDKANGVGSIPASKFRIEPVPFFDVTDDHDGTVPKLVYVSESDRTAREHIADTYEVDHGVDHQDRVDAEKWLAAYLKDNPGVLSAEAKKAAKKDASISERTLQRARQKLGVVIGYESTDGSPPVSTWTLDGEDGPVSHGTTAQGGTTAGQDAMPRCATSDDWHNVAQGQEQEICQQEPAVPHQNMQAAPGGLTPDTPGQTDRVAKALENARFTPPAGADRCSDCHWHIETQGHAQDCGLRVAS